MDSEKSDATKQTGTASKYIEPEIDCEHCKGTKSGRNLVVAFDGTSNQFGDNNTNVIELYNRIIKDDDTQLAYYNSGIGTYARPTWRSLAHLRQVVLHKFDLAIAWNFESIILKGYRWLSDHYKPGDKIFLFGFSRGAYQVRVLAGMIATVGLILPGNEEQIPFAYELYADLKHHKAMPSKSHEEGPNSGSMADRFKETFSRKSVSLHFVGVWDTVSSVGIIRGKNLPFTNENGHICYVRHALALDERRVKFLPEYVWGGASSDMSTSPIHNQPSKQEVVRERVRQRYTNPGDDHGTGRPGGAQQDDPLEKTKVGSSDRETSINDSMALPLKEVWFLGTHSDIGGGNVTNKELNNAAVPVLWMGNEALMAGLKLAPSRVEWDFDKLAIKKPKDSMNSVWRFMELLPFRRLTYADPNETCWWPHMSQGRIIKSGQKIHASVAFTQNYSPKAKFEKGMKEEMMDIVGKGNKEDKYNCEWMEAIDDILEKDLFDHSAAGGILARFKDGELRTDLSHRLRFIATSREGGRAIIAADENLEIVVGMLDSDTIQAAGGTVRADSCDILASMAKNGLAPLHLVKNDAVYSAVSTMIEEGDPEESISASRLLRRFSDRFGSSMRVDRSTITCLSNMMMRPETKVRTNACKTLFNLSEQVNVWSVNPIDEEIAGFLDTQDATAKIAGAWIIAKLSNNEGSLPSHPDVFDKFAHMLQDKEPAVSSSGIHALSTCVQYERALAALSASEVVHSIAVTLHHSHDPQQHWACAELLKALSARGKVGILLSQRNLFPCIVEMLGTDDEDEVETAAGILATLAKDAECQTSMIEKKVVSKVIDLFYEHLKGASPAKATTVLATFAQYPRLRDEIIRQDITAKLINMLNDISLDKQDRALRVLKCFAIHEEFRISIMNRDIVHRVVVKLKKKTHPDITTASLDFLEELSNDEHFRSDFSRKRVVVKVVSMFKKGRSSVKIHAASFLQAISQHDELRTAVVLANVFPTLTEMLKHGHENERLAAIDLLAAFPEESCKALLRSEYAFQAIIRMFDTGSAVEKIRAARLLKIFAQYPEFRNVAVVQMDVIHLSVAKLSRDVAANRRSALKVLSAYLVYDEPRAQIRKEKVIPKLIDILKENTCATRFKVTGFLGELVVYPEFRPRMPPPDEMIPILTSQLDAVQESDDRALVRGALKAFAAYENYWKMIPRQVLESLETEANGKAVQ